MHKCMTGHLEAKGAPGNVSKDDAQILQALRLQIVRLTEQAACKSSLQSNYHGCQQVHSLSIVQTMSTALALHVNPSSYFSFIDLCPRPWYCICTRHVMPYHALAKSFSTWTNSVSSPLLLWMLWGTRSKLVCFSSPPALSLIWRPSAMQQSIKTCSCSAIVRSVIKPRRKLLEMMWSTRSEAFHCHRLLLRIT